MFQRIGAKAFKKDLGNIQWLVSQLDHPESELNCIHVAGTNGKGSTCFMLAASLHELGYKVGLYTSPHYRDYRERIRVGTKMISKQYVIRFVEQLRSKGVFDSEKRPSFFEITVAMAFSYFRDQKVDIAVIETGLGGRLDSTNIIHPAVSLITNIGYDHMTFLGNTLEKIAGEKAGIIKKEVPVIIGKTQKETKSVFLEKAKQMNAAIAFADELPRKRYLEKLSVQFPEYQYENLYSSYYTLRKLLPPKLLKKLESIPLAKSMRKWGFMGRYQIVSHRPKIILDSAHNKEGINALFEQVAKEKYKQLHIVMAVVNDKDLNNVLDLFPKSAKYYFSQARIPRALDKHKLKESAASFDLNGRSYISVRKALAAAKTIADTKDLILICGSIFTVAEVV